MEDVQADGSFPRDDVLSFLAEFLDGVRTEGLTQPLQSWTRNREGEVANAARSLLSMLVAGDSLEASLANLDPGFPSTIDELLAVGASSGELDYVLEDLLAVVRASEGNEHEAVVGLSLEYSQRPTGSAICQGCLAREVDRLLRRADAEGAGEVHVSWDREGYMLQRFLGNYVVSVRQPSREAVVEGMKDLIQGAGGDNLGFGVGVAEDGAGWLLERSGQRLNVLFG